MMVPKIKIKIKITVLLGLLLWVFLFTLLTEAHSSSDSDNDGITDYEEVVGGTNPYNSDTDGDGFYAQIGCGTVDCDETSAAINPGALVSISFRTLVFQRYIVA